MRHERGRFMREAPMNYRRMRETDRGREEVTARLCALEFEQLSGNAPSVCITRS